MNDVFRRLPSNGCHWSIYVFNCNNIKHSTNVDLYKWNIFKWFHVSAVYLQYSSGPVVTESINHMVQRKYASDFKLLIISRKLYIYCIQKKKQRSEWIINSIFDTCEFLVLAIMTLMHCYWHSTSVQPIWKLYQCSWTIELE